LVGSELMAAKVNVTGAGSQPQPLRGLVADQHLTLADQAASAEQDQGAQTSAGRPAGCRVRLGSSRESGIPPRTPRQSPQPDQGGADIGEARAATRPLPPSVVVMVMPVGRAGRGHRAGRDGPVHGLQVGRSGDPAAVPNIASNATATAWPHRAATWRAPRRSSGGSVVPPAARTSAAAAASPPPRARSGRPTRRDPARPNATHVVRQGGPAVGEDRCQCAREVTGHHGARQSTEDNRRRLPSVTPRIDAVTAAPGNPERHASDLLASPPPRSAPAATDTRRGGEQQPERTASKPNRAAAAGPCTASRVAAPQGNRPGAR